MAVEIREPVTMEIHGDTVTEGAVRMFLAGYLGKLRRIDSEDGHVYYRIPSETEPGRCYQIDWQPATGIVRCSCATGKRKMLCKHVRLFQLDRGWTNEGVGA